MSSSLFVLTSCLLRRKRNMGGKGKTGQVKASQNTKKKGHTRKRALLLLLQNKIKI